MGFSSSHPINSMPDPICAKMDGCKKTAIVNGYQCERKHKRGFAAAAHINRVSGDLFYPPLISHFRTSSTIARSALLKCPSTKFERSAPVDGVPMPNRSRRKSSPHYLKFKCVNILIIFYHLAKINLHNVKPYF